MSLLIQLDNVSRIFGPMTVLDRVTLHLPVGRIGLLGPNGAGKSTLLKILMGLLPVSSGSGSVLGEPLGKDTNNWRLRRLIGYMPEASSLVPGLTGLEYVSLAGQLYGMSRRQANRRAQEVLSYLELEEARFRRIEEYSMGMKQRAKLAQALIHDPPVLLLDEPTSGLDPAGRDAMLRLIATLGKDHGKSVLLSTHLLADVETVCEQVVILAGGQLRGVGSVKEICARRGDRYKLKIQGESTAFLTALETQGATVTSNESRAEWSVTVPTDWQTNTFFAVALQTGVVVRSLTRDDETLEEHFLNAVR